MKQADREIIALLAQIRDAAASGGGGSGGAGGAILAAGTKGGNIVGPSSTGYLTFAHTGSANTTIGPTFSATESERQIIVPKSGTLKSFYARTSTAQPADGDFTLTIRINGVDTDIVILIAANAGAGTFSEVAETAAVAAGDLLSFSLVNASADNSAAMHQWSLVVE